MKKILLLTTLFALLLFTACTATPEEKKVEENTTTLSGAYHYYIEADETTGPFRETVQKKVCFEPAQLEQVNQGQFFCFTNTKEALKILKIKDLDENCKEAIAGVKISIKDLTNKPLSNWKGDPCVSAGTCDLNEAELIELIEELKGEPFCRE